MSSVAIFEIGITRKSTLVCKKITRRDKRYRMGRSDENERKERKDENKKMKQEMKDEEVEKAEEGKKTGEAADDCLLLRRTSLNPLAEQILD